MTELESTLISALNAINTLIQDNRRLRTQPCQIPSADWLAEVIKTAPIGLTGTTFADNHTGKSAYIVAEHIIDALEARTDRG